MSKIVFGVDIGGTAVKLGVFDENAALLEKWSILTDTSNDGAYIIPAIASTIKDKITEMGLTNDDAVGIGLTVPGTVVDEQTVNRCVNLGWGVKNVAREMELVTGLPVAVANDANLAALAEAHFGAGRGYKHVFMMTIGTGIGGGMVIDGKMYVGGGGVAAELGHLHVNDEETLQCTCGNYGCLEQYASATGVVRIAHQMLKSFGIPSPLRDLDNTTGFSAKDIYDLAANGDSIADLSTNVAMGYLGRGAALIANTFNPEIIVIGGGVAAAGDIILNKIMPDFKKYAFHAVRDTTKFAFAELGNDAGIYGAAKLILDREV